MSYDAEHLEDLFVSLINLDASAQTETLQRLRQEDPATADTLAKMLKGYTSFDEDIMEVLEPNVIQGMLSGDTLNAQNNPKYKPKVSVSTGLPNKIGDYHILEEIGQGGMGTVFLAESESPKRRVALKRLSITSDSLSTRFETEYQAHAQMKHANIAALFDVGKTPEGQTFYTMEHLDGLPLTDYCERHDLSTNERLKLFRQVCRGVQHAHQRATLHRDLKPSNIIVVTTKDGPVAKIIDFGLAKDLSCEDTFLELTQQGQIMGTPLYMSPEQLKGESIDTRSDIYALGVILYQLLARRHPLNIDRLKSVSFPELLRVCIEEEPPLPSVRLAEANTLKKAAYVRGDLDAITAMAMAKEADARYASVEQLVNDLDRFSAGHPVRAVRPGHIYWMKKFIKRNRLMVTASTLAASALLIGLTIATVSIVELRKANHKTKKALEKAEVSLSFLQNTFSSADPREMGPKALVVDLLSSAEDRLDTLDAGSPIVGSLAATWGRTYFGLGMYRESEQLLRKALEAMQKSQGDGNSETSTVRYYLALALMRQKSLDEAKAVIETCLRHQEKDPNTPPTELLRSKAGKAMILAADQKYQEAESLFQEVYKQQVERLGPDHQDTTQSLVGLGNAFMDDKEYSRAEAIYREALKHQEVNPGPRSPDALATRSQLGYALYKLRRFDKAEAVYRETVEMRTAVLGQVHPLTISVRKRLADCLYRQEKYEQAEPMYLALISDTQDINDSRALQIRGDAEIRLAILYDKTDRLDQTIMILHTLIGRVQDPNGNHNKQTLAAMHNLGHYLKKRGDLSASREIYEQALTGRMRLLGDRHRNTLTTLHDLGVLNQKLGDPSAGPLLHHAWTIYQEKGHHSKFQLAYADWLLSQKRQSEARIILEALYNEACQKDQKRLPQLEERLSIFRK